MKHLICYSGGHSSALVALEVAKKFGTGDLILLNHNINPSKEAPDIKRFNAEVAAYIGIPITYANFNGINAEEDIPDQFDIALDKGAIVNPANFQAICTYHLKTKPFYDYLDKNFPNKDCIIYYGFDKEEIHRIDRRKQILGAMGYQTDFPVALWDRTIQSTNEIGIPPPMTYSTYKHANCVGCLKAGLLHWYVTYNERPDVYKKAVDMEEELGYTIHSKIENGEKKSISLRDLAKHFCEMKNAGIEATEHQSAKKFAQRIDKYNPELTLFADYKKPCECLI